MLFNSIEFLVFFLPATLAGYFLALRFKGARWAVAWLVAASLFFYGWWNPTYVVLLVLSVLFNFNLGKMIATAPRSASPGRLMAVGVAANLLCLGWFKYSHFLADNMAALGGPGLSLPEIVLPLGISFFTFQQIAYLVDCRRGQATEPDFARYCLFVTFFPQLIAGPIVHHKEMMPQFARRAIDRAGSADIAIGLTILAIGLFKKVILADGIAEYVTPVFNEARAGNAISLFPAWGAALSYTFQLYFDFSAYSDMAVGIARMFSIRLPLNFFSPYKATSIIEFWRRWHMTLSRFLRDYLYFPLGGNRNGPARRYVNLLCVMAIGGLWHGAGWTFVFWGVLHGIYLCINHAWHAVLRALGLAGYGGNAAYRLAAWALTFLAVVVGWVFFRAESFPAALNVLSGMAGWNGAALPPLIAGAFAKLGLAQLPADESLGDMAFVLQWMWIGGAMFIALALPNTYEWMATAEPVLERVQARIALVPAWRLAWPSAVLGGILIFAALRNLLDDVPSEFLYFQF